MTPHRFTLQISNLDQALISAANLAAAGADGPAITNTLGTYTSALALLKIESERPATGEQARLVAKLLSIFADAETRLQIFVARVRLSHDLALERAG